MSESRSEFSQGTRQRSDRRATTGQCTSGRWGQGPGYRDGHGCLWQLLGMECGRSAVIQSPGVEKEPGTRSLVQQSLIATLCLACENR